MPQHTTVSGHVIDYPEPEPKVAAILKRLARMADDPKATEDQMVALAYSSENPLLGPDLFPSRGAVTKETLLKPAWHVMQDYLARKYIAENGISLDKLAEEYTMTMSEAARHLGIQPSAVRLAVQTSRLPAWVKDGTYYISPKALDSYEVTKTGPAPQLRVRVAPLAVCIGNAEGKSFRLKHPGELADKTDVEGGHIVAGRIARWRRVAILSGRRGDYRFAEIAPAETENEYRFGPFYVRGRFDMKKINDSERAYDAWKAFQPE
jgi:hypothetical protein